MEACKLWKHSTIVFLLNGKIFESFHISSRRRCWVGSDWVYVQVTEKMTGYSKDIFLKKYDKVAYAKGDIHKTCGQFLTPYPYLMDHFS